MQPWQRTLIPVLFARVCMDIGMTSISPFMPLYLRTIGVTDVISITQWVGTIAASVALTQAVAQPIWGNLADRWGRKPMMIRSMLSSSTVAMLMATASSPWHLLGFRLLEGSFSGSLGVTNALVASSVPKERLGFALGLTQVSFYFGASIGPLVGGIIADNFGFRVAYVSGGGMMILAASIVILFVRENFTPAPAAAAVPGQRQGRTVGIRQLLAISLFPTLIGITFLNQMGGTIVNPILTLVIADINGMTNAATMSGLVVGAAAAMSAGSAVVIGLIGDRIGRSRIIIVCLIGASLAYLPQGLVHNVWQFLALRMLLGVFVGGLMPTVNAFIADTVPGEKRGFAFGLTTSASSLAGAVGPLLSAAITADFGLHSIFFATSAFYGLNACQVAWNFYRARKRPLAPGPDNQALPHPLA